MAARRDAIPPPPPVDAATLRAARRFLALVGERCPVREAHLFGREAIEPGHVPADLGKALDRVEQLRMTADHFEISVTPDEAAWAEAFLGAAGAMIAGT